jgi:hypothetical protein
MENKFYMNIITKSWEVYGSVTAATKATTKTTTISTTNVSLELGWFVFINNNKGKVVYVIIAC